MAASAQLPRPALSKRILPAPMIGRRAPRAGRSAPMISGLPLDDLSQGPLTSEPPLADAAPLTSEPPLADTAPLTSEPTAPGTAGGTEFPGV
ncbi:hypothetical protein [Streptomyces sp. NPDC088725]|uniref:hypothetical protein n=1 Tax=Streptomyces sp. NPDC088725 TaxID=3365873 RepID=UPI003823E8B2